MAKGIKSFDSVLQFGDSWRLGVVNGSDGKLLSLSHVSGNTAIVWSSDGQTTMGPIEENGTWNQTEGHSHKTIKSGEGQRWVV